MISKKLALEVINNALSTGADYAEIFYEESTNHNLNVENGVVENAASTSIGGVGLRLLKDKKCIYGYTNDVSKKGLLSLAESLKSSFKGERVLSVESFTKIKCKNRNPIEISYNDVPLKEKIDLIRIGTDEIAKMNDKRIVRTNGMFVDNHRSVTFYNSKGKTFKRDTEFGRIIFMVVAASEKGMETGFEAKGVQQSITFFKNYDIKSLARKAAKGAIDTLEAVECPNGVMPVVIGNGWGGVLFHESCGHPLEASSVAKGLSVFSGKEGEMIASKVVSAVDDSTIPGSWGSIDIDDEGNLGERRYLIKNGKLTNFMIDDFNGRRMNRSGNGACRRQNYKYCPTSRMSNTYICNGKSTKEEIIKSVKLGLYAVSFNGGSVDPATGEFNFGCSEAYIIRDGKIAERVKGATLIGKGFEILKNIDMVANDLDLAEGMCGAASGSVRTDVGQPTLRVSQISVGGRGGKLE